MSLTRVPITMFEPTSGGGSIVGLNNVVSNTNSYVIGSGITTSLNNTTYVDNLSSLGFISSPVLSGSYLYGDGSRLSNIYRAPSAATFSASVSAPAMSGTHYGDGGNLTGVLRSSGGGNLNGNVTINNGNLTVFGNISATGTSTFVNAVFTSTSALSVVNTGGSVALWIGGNNNADIASFYDIDQGKEVLHVGGINPGTQVPYIGINTSSPNKTLTVVGEVSATNAFFGTTGTFYTSVSAPTLSGDGTGLTINADKLLTGTLNNARLSAAATFSSYISAPALSGTHYGDGTFLSNVKDSSKLNLSGGVVTNYLHLGTGSLVISAGDLTLGNGNITTPGSVAIGGSLVRSKLDLNNKVIAGVQNIRGHADDGAWSLWGGLGTNDSDVNGGNIALYGSSNSVAPNTVIINSAGVQSAKFNADGITFSKPLTANSGITISGNLSTNGTVAHGTTTISGNLSTFGSATVGTLTALGPVTISGTLSSSGLATLGAATIKGNLSAQGTIASSDLTLNSTAAQEGGQINFARPSDNANAFAIDVFSDVANNNNSRLRVINIPQNSELMSVLSSGNVGIGTAFPGYKLEVNGGAYVGSLTANSNVSFINNNSRIVKNTTDNGLEFFTLNASRMFIADATGNVGIGTSAPSTILEVRRDQNATTYQYINNQDQGSSADASLKLASYGCQWTIANGSVAKNTNALTFAHSNIGELMRFTADGKVGIGTSAPTAKLDVNGTTNLRSQINLGSALVQNIAADATNLYLRGGGFAFQDAAASTTKMFINSLGNVGIGTNVVVEYGLHIYKPVGLPGGIRVQSGTEYSEVVMHDYAGLYVSNGSATLPTMFYNNGSESMRITSAGKVGIGTASPIQHVHIKSPQSAPPVQGVGLVPLLIENSAAKSSQMIFGVSQAVGDYNSLTQTGDQVIIFKADSTIADSVAGNLVIGPHSATNYGMRLTYDGKIGVGTPFPNQKLTVVGNISASGNLYGDGSNITGIDLTTKISLSASTYIAVIPGDNLLTKYAAATALTPNSLAKSATNRAALLIYPGTYNLGASVFNLTTEFVDIVGVTGDPSHVVITSTGAATLSCSNSLNDCLTKAVTLSGSAAGFSYAPGYSNSLSTRMDNVVFNTTMKYAATTYAGTYTNCTAIGDYAFGGSSNMFSYPAYASGKFINCTATGNSTFGGSSYASGSFTNCTAIGDFAFGGKQFAVASGTFNNCNAYGTYSFGANGNASGTFTNCNAYGDHSFGGGSAPTGHTTGIFVNCYASGINAFGTNSIPQGKFINCRTTDSFPTLGAGGIQINCIDGSYNIIEGAG